MKKIAITIAIFCMTTVRISFAQTEELADVINGDNNTAVLLEKILTADDVAACRLLDELDGSTLERATATDLVKMWLYSIAWHRKTKMQNAYQAASDPIVAAENDPSLELTDLGRHYLQQLFRTQYRRLNDAIALQRRMEAVIEHSLPAVAPALAHFSCTKTLKANKAQCIPSLMNSANSEDDPHRIASFAFLRQHFPELEIDAPTVEALKSAAQSKDIYLRLHSLQALVLEKRFDIAAACSRQFANDARQELMKAAITSGVTRPDEEQSRFDEYQREQERRETEALKRVTKEIETGIGERFRGRGPTGYVQVKLTDWEMVDALIQRAGLLERMRRGTVPQTDVTAQIEKDYDHALEICRQTKTTLPADTYTPYTLFLNRGLYFKSFGDSMQNQANGDAQSEFYRRAVVEYDRAEKALPLLKLDETQRSNTLHTLLSFRSNALISLEEWQRALDDFATYDLLTKNAGRRIDLNEYQLLDRASCHAGIGQLEMAIPLFRKSVESTFSTLLDQPFSAFLSTSIDDDTLASAISLANVYHANLTKLENSSEIDRLTRRVSELIGLLIAN